MFHSWSGKVETTKVALELTWLYHEIGASNVTLFFVHLLLLFLFSNINIVIEPN